MLVQVALFLCLSFQVAAEALHRQPRDVQLRRLNLDSVPEGRVVDSDISSELGVRSGRPYRFSSVPASATLFVESDRARLRSRSELDYEVDSSLWVLTHVYEVEGSILKLVDSVNITLQVQDVNDSPPRFTNVPSPMVALLDGSTASIGDTVYLLSVRDSDALREGVLRGWRIDIQSRDNSETMSRCSRRPCIIGSDYFAIEGVDAAGLYRPRSNDPKRTEMLPLLVKTSPIPSNTELIIPLNIQDESGNSDTDFVTVYTGSSLPPQFEKPEYDIQLPESTSINTAFARVAAVSFSHSEIIYDLKVISGDQFMFGIDRYSGDLRLQKELDFEALDSFDFKLLVTATEPIIGGLTSDQEVSVTVVDSNDCEPKFSQSLYVKQSLSESSPVGTEILTVSVSDCDSTWPNNMVTVSSEDPRFYLDNSTRVLRLAKKLDYESADELEFLFKIIATDGALDARSSSAQVKIYLSNEQDESPKFLNTKADGCYEESVSESINDETIVAKIDAVDPDGLSNIKFYIQDAIAVPFVITEDRGIVRKKPGASFDKRYYEMRIRAVTGATRESQTTLTVHILEENNFKPRFLDCDTIRTVSEAAEPTSGAAPVFTIEATDEDTGRYGQIKYGIMNVMKPELETEFEIRQRVLNDQPYANKIRVIGEVYLTRKISRDRGATRTVTINATDTYDPYTDTLMDENYNVGVCTVKIDVIDANDKAPEFVYKNYDEQPVYIPSSKPVGETIVRVVAYDNDEGANGEIFYTISNDNGGQLPFSIDRTTGEISVRPSNSLANIQDEKQFALTVVASDMGTPSLSTSMTVNINVFKASNLEPPSFVKGETTITIPENHAIGNSQGMQIGTFQATTSGSDLVIITLEAGQTEDTNLNRVFQIPASANDTHLLYVVKPLDYERIKKYYLTVKASLSQNKEIYTLRQVTVEVTDVNDVYPVFVANNGWFSGFVKEDDPAGSYVTTVYAEDDDTGLGGQVRYQIQPDRSRDDEFFRINSTSGEITLKKPLNEGGSAKSVYGFNVMAIDQTQSANPGTRGGNTHLIRVEINVLDVNDNPPVFEKEVYSSQVKETAAIGTPVLTVNAKDIDNALNQTITYRIEAGNFGGAFSIDKTDGVIKIASPLNYDVLDENQKLYQLSVVASDGKFSGYTNVRIEVLDVNDEPPRFDQDSYTPNVDVTENSTDLVGQVIAQVRAVDGDIYNPGAIKYKLDGFEAGKYFSIDSSTGEIRVARVLDREYMSQWNFLVLAEDISAAAPGSQMDTAQFTVNVLDIDDNAPFFNVPNKRGTVPEGRPSGTPVMTMTADDPDESPIITYRLVDPPTGDDGQPLFVIDEETGKIATNALLDRESPPTVFELEVEATDSAGHSATGIATVEVTDVNDNAPKCTKYSHVTSVSEGATSGEAVFSFTISDEDSDSVNGGNTVNIIDGNANGVFALTTPDHGVVKLIINPQSVAALDYESNRKVYNLTLKVKDDTADTSSYPEFNEYQECKIDIKVLDYNDNKPVVKVAMSEQNVMENSEIGSVVGTVTATDVDENGQQRINLEVDWATDEMGWFGVRQTSQANNPIVGEIYVKSAIDREMISADGSDVYLFNILGIDQPKQLEQPQLTGAAQVTITIGDVNDNAPVWKENYKPVVPENHEAPWEQVVEAIDFDDENHGEPISIKWPDGKTSDPDFTLTRGPGLNQATISANHVFDRELKPNYPLKFKLCDKDNICADRPLVIYIGDKNDNMPYDGSTFIHAYVLPELGADVDIDTSVLETDIGEVHVTDKDCCERSTQSYTMLDSDDDRIREHFSLNGGTVRLHGGTEPGEYEFKVLVTDSKFPEASATSVVRVLVENLPPDAMMNAVALRVKGLTAAEFISVPEGEDKSPQDKFKESMAKQLNTRPEYVDIFSIKDLPAVNVPVYPHIFDDDTIEITFAAHGSPYYGHAKMYGTLSESRDDLEESMHVLLDGTVLNLCPGSCGVDEECTTALKFINQPHSVVGRNVAFVGVSLEIEALCGVCGAVQTVYLPEEMDPSLAIDPCWKNPCKNGGECVKVVTDVVNYQPVYDYRCECGSLFDGPNCERTTLSFLGDGAYAWFDPIPPCGELTLNLRFATKNPNGLLFFDGSIREDPDKPDFIALELVDGKLKLSADFGAGVVSAMLAKDNDHPVADGRWHQVDIFIKKESMELQLDMCRHARITESSSQGESTQPYGTCFVSQYIKGRKLDVSDPLQIGGITPGSYKPVVLSRGDISFQGCIGHVRVNGYLIDMESSPRKDNTLSGCVEEDCVKDNGEPRCSIHGTCIATFDRFLYCDCDPFYTGPECREETPEFKFNRDSIIRYAVDLDDPISAAANRLNSDRQTDIMISFKTTRVVAEAILLTLSDVNDPGFIRLYLDESILSVKHNLAGRGEQVLQLRDTNVTDGNWHTARLERDGKRFRLSVDGGAHPNDTAYSDEGYYRLLQLDPDSIMIGGFIQDPEQSIKSSFEGCISDVRFNRVQLPVGTMSRIDGVGISNRTGIHGECDIDLCPDAFCYQYQCYMVYDRYYCGCPEGQFYSREGLCVDINECAVYFPCEHGTCFNLDEGYRCECETGWYGKNCDVQMAAQSTDIIFRLSTGAIIIILLAIIICIILMLIYICYKCTKRHPKGLLHADLDIGDGQNIGKGSIEGGGEKDADFNIQPLRVLVSKPDLGNLTPSFHGSKPHLQNGYTPTTPGSHGRDNPQFVPSPVPSREPMLGRPMQPGDDVGTFLRQRIPEVDKATANMGHDTLMVYHYEGAGSEAGTISEVASQASDANFDRFHNWGPPFHRLADMFADQSQSNQQPDVV